MAKKETKITREMYAKIVETMLIKGLGSSINPAFREDYFLLGIQPINPEKYLKNPYVKTIKPSQSSLGKWQLRYEQYDAYQGFPLGDVRVLPEKGFREITPIGFSAKPFKFLTIQEKQSTWMSLTPFEIETMQTIIDQVNGHVLTLGLGLGYFAFMAALKPSVSNVTIVERDTTVIQLFKTHLLPHFPYPEKIIIQQKDAIIALPLLAKQEKFDHLFVDIYHDAVDGLQTYLKIKPQEKMFGKTKVHYWLEASILSLFRRYVVIYLEEQIHHIPATEYETIGDFDDAMLHYLHQQYKQTQIHTFAQLTKLLSSEGLKNLLQKPFRFPH